MSRHPLHTAAATLLAGIALAGCAEAPTSADAAALGVGTAARSRSAADCRTVSGTITGASIPIFDADGLAGFDVIGTGATGALAGGSISASLVVEEITPAGTIHFGGGHRFVDTFAGTFSTSDKGITTGKGRIHDTLTLVDGGTGQFQTQGSVDLTTGALELTYHGRICPQS